MTFSIGDVLDQLHNEFPDITVSKIRFLESQGLIAPMRTSSGFRMFSEVDISKLKWILSHQRDRFLPLKVIKEYLMKLTDNDFEGGNSPSFDFEDTGTLPLNGISTNAMNNIGGSVSVLSPVKEISHLAAVREDQNTKQDDNSQSSSSSTLVQAVAQSQNAKKSFDREDIIKMQESPFSKDSIITRSKENQTAKSELHPIRISHSYDVQKEKLDTEELIGATATLSSITKPKAKKQTVEAVLSLEKMTIETSISGPVLKELVKYSILESTGDGNAMVFDKSQIDVAIVVSKMLNLGIEPRLLKTYVLFAGREVSYLEHVTQEDLRKRNPQATSMAKDKAIEFIRQSASLKELLLLREYKKDSE